MTKYSRMMLVPVLLVAVSATALSGCTTRKTEAAGMQTTADLTTQVNDAQAAADRATAAAQRADAAAQRAAAAAERAERAFQLGQRK